VLTEITKIYSLSERPVQDFELHTLMGWEFDSTDFPNINVYRLDLCNIWIYFTEVYFPTPLVVNIMVYQK